MAKKQNHNESEEEYEVESLQGFKKSGNTAQFLVKWVGYDEKENTWEPTEHLLGTAESSVVKTMGESLAYSFDAFENVSREDFIKKISEQFNLQRDSIEKKRAEEKRKAEEAAKRAAEKRKRSDSDSSTKRKKRTKKAKRTLADIFSPKIVKELKRLGLYHSNPVPRTHIYNDIQDRELDHTVTQAWLHAIESLSFKYWNPKKKEDVPKTFVVPEDESNAPWAGDVIEMGIVWMDDHDSSWVRAHDDAVFIGTSDDYGFLVRQRSTHDPPMVYIVKFESDGYVDKLPLDEFLQSLKTVEPKEE